MAVFPVHAILLTCVDEAKLLILNHTHDHDPNLTKSFEPKPAKHRVFIYVLVVI